MQPLRQAIKQSRFTAIIPIKKDGNEFSAIFQTMTKAFILVPENDWLKLLDRIANGSATAEDQDTIEGLKEQGILVQRNVDESTVFESWKQQCKNNFSLLRSKILVTRQCNNRCSYCIIDPESAAMSQETAELMDKFYIGLIKERNPRQVQDDFLGGEPFLNPKVVLDCATRRYYYCMGKGVEYGFTVTTNGTRVRPSLVSRLKNVGLNAIRVSMAGPEDVHDRLRPSKDGSKTYARIMRNLETISGLVPILIECQYDSSSTDYLRIPEMINDFDKRGIPVKEIAFNPILPSRRSNQFQSGMGDPAKLSFLNELARKRGYLLDEIAPACACATDFRSRIVFDSDGSIIACPSVQSGEFVYGHVSKGIDFVAESQIRSRKLDERCLTRCELLPICFGGCRLLALTNQRGFDGVDCQYDTYRIFLEDYMRSKAASALTGQAGETHTATSDLREAA